jgi:haloacid dehalogenase-like hydrolase
MRIVVDFDGTIVEHEFPEIGSLKTGVIEALSAFRREGHEIVISSGRNSISMNKKFQKEMIEFLDEKKVPYDFIDDGKSGKIIADFYIDDRAIRFENNWKEITRKLLGE